MTDIHQQIEDDRDLVAECAAFIEKTERAHAEFVRRSERNRQEFLERVGRIMSKDASATLSGRVLDEIQSRIRTRHDA